MCTVLDCEHTSGGCVSHHMDMQQIYSLIQQIFTVEYKDKLNVTLAHKHLWSWKADRSMYN